MTHALDVEAQIHFFPESGSMVIRFSGFHDGGMPHFSNQLLDLACGARRVTIDLRDLWLTDPESTVESIRAILGQPGSDIEILVADAEPDPALTGSYHAG